MKCPTCGQEINKQVDMAQFDRFWKAWPKKQAKKDAQKAFKQLSPSPELLEKILRNIELQKKTDSWKKENGKYIPLPASYLRGERWEDELEIKSDPITPKPKKSPCCKCGNESVSIFDDDKPYCQDCWPKRRPVSGIVSGILKEMPGTMSENETERRIANLRKQGEFLKSQGKE